MIGRYRLSDMVFAKCQSYPYWPGKIISALPNGTSYKVLFYGEKSQATIDETFIMPFNEETYKKMTSQTAAKTNKALKYSLTVAYKRYSKRKKGLNSSSEEEDFFQESQVPKKSEIQESQKAKNSKTYTIKLPQDPHVELGNLLNLLSNQASNFKKLTRVFTVEHEARLRQLLDPSAGLLLASLIQSRIIQRFILVLKQLDMWGLRQFPQLDQLHQLIRKRYNEYKEMILSQNFAAIPLREAKRERIIQKVIMNRAVL